MYLFINTAITDNRLGTSRTVNSNRVDIFKYCISSLSIVPFNEVFIYLHFYENENLKDRKLEVETHIKKSFSHTKLNLYNFRNEYQSQWKKSLQPIIDGKFNSVWFMCNDDHIFLDSELDTILSARNIIENTNENIAMYLSHWPEMLKRSEKLNSGKLYNKYFQFWEDFNCDSILFMHKNILYDWWFNHNYNDRFMPRSDWPGADVKCNIIKMLTPLREQCRHFEGYPHIGLTEEDCPPLIIPNNFFNNNINLTIPDYNIYHEKDIPLFWKNKINKLKTNNNNLQKRIDFILKVANSHKGESNVNIKNNLIEDIYSI